MEYYEFNLIKEIISFTNEFFEEDFDILKKYKIFNFRYFILRENSNFNVGINKMLTYANPRYIFFHMSLINDKKILNRNQILSSDIINNNICIIIFTTTKKFGKVFKENLCKQFFRIISYKLKGIKYIFNNDDKIFMEIESTLINKKNIISQDSFIIKSSFDILIENNIDFDREKGSNINNLLNDSNSNNIKEPIKISVKELSEIFNKGKFIFMSENFMKEFDKKLYLNVRDNYETRFEKEIFYKDIIQNSFYSIFDKYDMSYDFNLEKPNLNEKYFNFYEKYYFSFEETIEILNDIFMQTKFFISKYL